MSSFLSVWAIVQHHTLSSRQRIRLALAAPALHRLIESMLPPGQSLWSLLVAEALRLSAMRFEAAADVAAMRAISTECTDLAAALLHLLQRSEAESFVLKRVQEALAVEALFRARAGEAAHARLYGPVLRRAGNQPRVLTAWIRTDLAQRGDERALQHFLAGAAATAVRRMQNNDAERNALFLTPGAGDARSTSASASDAAQREYLHVLQHVSLAVRWCRDAGDYEEVSSLAGVRQWTGSRASGLPLTDLLFRCNARDLSDIEFLDISREWPPVATSFFRGERALELTKQFVGQCCARLLRGI